ncbi:1-phosphatidylinositol 4,5-bisphosphate phosphodiesterase delta-4 isoform X2 [Agelaius phoeniceus]|uniref:1-phosphatidylinositol 4,5-bisphosphate phosphodiesterase delta-4 isoform X2 n=1 Tax=Agelaius phoeniceus TaxID=39638 RepID=UPI004054A352
MSVEERPFSSASWLCPCGAASLLGQVVWRGCCPVLLRRKAASLPEREASLRALPHSPGVQVCQSIAHPKVQSLPFTLCPQLGSPCVQADLGTDRLNRRIRVGARPQTRGSAGCSQPCRPLRRLLYLPPRLRLGSGVTLIRNDLERQRLRGVRGRGRPAGAGARGRDRGRARCPGAAEGRAARLRAAAGGGAPAERSGAATESGCCQRGEGRAMASLLCNARIQLTDTLEQMQQGTLMRKVKSKSWKKQRYFKLQEDCMTIWYQSKRTGKTESAFSISDVETVREGHQSEVLQSVAEEFPPERCFTIVFYGRRGNLDLVAGSAEEAQCWVQGLRQLIEVATTMDQREKIDQWIRDWFQKADKNKDGRMNFKEVQRLLKMMNVDMNEDHALRLFQDADKSESGTLEGEEFVLFYKALTKREEVLSLFQEYSEDGKKLTLLELADFLREEQLEDEGTEELAMELIDKYEPSETARARHVLSADGFLMYLCSLEGSIFNPQHRGLWQDMSQPLCHYFISSSHNTYLIEDQIRGHSSIEGYIRALKRGCRCLEVDCWDGPNGEPMVYHGHTFTSKIPFREVVSTLGKYAFKTSDYPVILSLENHCSMEQQEVLAQQLKDILGEQLLTTTIDGHVPTQLPSPEELKHKILLKGKKIGRLEDTLDGPGDEAPDVSDDDNGAEAEEERRRAKDKETLAQALSDCVIYCKNVPFRGFQEARSHSRPSEISSLSEAKARKLIRDEGNEFVRHNAWQLTRIYPSGMRTDSSNYSPQEMWNVGCQIVALNFQTAGMEMDLCDGLFSQNGCCGYVLKPPFMRDKETLFNPSDPSSREGPGPITLTIQVISGQQLPKVANSKEGAIIDPLVRVEIYGVPADQAHQETKYIENNGFNPRWDETLQFQLHVPELALIRFVVEDYDKTSRNDFVGQFTLAFANIKPGYRHIHLLSKDGTSIPPSSLFVHIRITEPPGPEQD